jgi:hypothetical protein
MSPSLGMEEKEQNSSEWTPEELKGRLKLYSLSVFWVLHLLQ